MSLIVVLFKDLFVFGCEYPGQLFLDLRKSNHVGARAHRPCRLRKETDLEKRINRISYINYRSKLPK